MSRNDPCPCGSGEKYKRCCEPKAGAKANQRALLGVLVVVVVAGGVWLATSLGADDDTPMLTPPGQSPVGASLQGGTTAQPGPAPPGKVWSPEHGHWHDAPPAQTGGPTPQPPGEPPPGKVWSPEHGHWHDAPAGGAPLEPVTQGGDTSHAPGAATTGDGVTP